MKVILNQDVKHLGEEGDIKDVANGYARNYLFPRNLAVPCNEMTEAYFESKKADIEARKAEKRAAAAGLKEKLEATTLTLVMPAGANGKLYGAVTNQTIAEELHKLGFEVERKRIEVPGLTLKSVGKYTINVRLYESTGASVTVVVDAQIDNHEKAAPRAEKAPRRRHESYDQGTEAVETPAAEETGASAE